jgi:RNA polymerase sigma factor (sigma-70 family)
MLKGTDGIRRARVDRAWTSDEHVFPLRLRTLTIGMRMTLLSPLVAAAALVLARRANVEMGPFGLVFVAVAVSAGLATLLPYERLFRMGWGMAALYVWSVVNLTLIAVGVWATGGSSSPLMFQYALTTMFFAVAFSPPAQAILLGLTVASYSVAVGASRWDPMLLAVLAVLAFLANLLVGQLKRQTAAHREARRESERRWALLAVVSAAARQMSAVEPMAVLRAVVDSVVALGFPTARIFVQEGADHQGALPLEAPEDFPEGIESLRFEAIEGVLVGGRAVVVGLAEDDALGGPLRRLGLSSAVVIPISAADRVDAILVVGIEEPPGPSPQDLEVFQMLATQAAVALENARRFERQRRSMERIAELDRMKSDFLSNVSHELRTPLTVIAGMGRTLEESWYDLSEADRRDLLARLNANAATLDSIIAELLDFGRLEAGRLQIKPRQVDLRELLGGVADRLASLLRNHVVQVDVADGLTVLADPLLIERVVENLLTNAAKYTPTGSRIRVSAIGHGPDAVIAVADDGPGIPPEETRHIGERFFRGGDPNTRVTRGTGLGLALVSEILDMHGTYLEVESELGTGSRFCFRLPRSHGTFAGQDGAGDGINLFSAPGELPRPLVVGQSGLSERFETVLAAAQAGLEWPVATLFREFHPRVLRYLRAHAPDRADELASETWNHIASALPEFEGDEGSFRRWVFAAARQRLNGARENGASSRSSQENEREGSAASAERRAVDAALVRIRTLAPEQADVLLLRAVGGLEVVDVAGITGSPPHVVRMTETEGLKRLRHDAETSKVPDRDRARSGMER